MKAILLTALLGFTLGITGAGAAEPKETKEIKSKPYPLTTCVVSDEKLGEMGDPYIFDHSGQQVKLCCKKCLKKFDAEPEKYMKKINDAAAKPKEADKKEVK